MTTALLPIRREARNMWDIAGELDRLFDASCEVFPSQSVAGGLWHPAMDIYNRKDDLVVELELPGLKPEDIDMSLQEDHLVVEGSRGRSSEYSEETVYFSERFFGGFHRVVHLPTSVDADGAKASFKDGLLTITLPKKARERGKRIELETG